MKTATIKASFKTVTEAITAPGLDFSYNPERAQELADQRQRYLRAARNTPVMEAIWFIGIQSSLTGLEPKDERDAMPYIGTDGRWKTTTGAGFFSSILASLLNGQLAADLPTKAKHILADDHARHTGRRGSRAYEAEYNRIRELIEATAHE